jgi:uncharacterized Zn ribbon protein
MTIRIIKDIVFKGEGFTIKAGEEYKVIDWYNKKAVITRRDGAEIYLEDGEWVEVK